MPLHFTPHSIWNWRFDISRNDAEPLAEIWLSSIRNRGTITLGDLTIGISVRGLLKPSMSFNVDERTIATGAFASMWRTRLWLESSGQHYELHGRKLGQALEVYRGGQAIGMIAKRGLTRKGSADLPSDVPLQDRLFLIAQALYSWKRQASAAAAGT
jgi:hypothetical protein